MTEKPKPPFPKGAWITEGPMIHLKTPSCRTVRRFRVIRDAEFGSGFRVGWLDANYYRLATPEEIVDEIELLEARIADLVSALICLPISLCLKARSIKSRFAATYSSLCRQYRFASAFLHAFSEIERLKARVADLESP